MVTKVNGWCMETISELENRFGDRVTFRGCDYGKHILTDQRDPLRYQGNQYIQRSAYL